MDDTTKAQRMANMVPHTRMPMPMDRTVSTNCDRSTALKRLRATKVQSDNSRSSSNTSNISITQQTMRAHDQQLVLDVIGMGDEGEGNQHAPLVTQRAIVFVW